MTKKQKTSDSTTIALPNKIFSGLLDVEHELEKKKTKTVSHGDTVEFLIQEHNTIRKKKFKR